MDKISDINLKAFGTGAVHIGRIKQWTDEEKFEVLNDSIDKMTNEVIEKSKISSLKLLISVMAEEAEVIEELVKVFRVCNNETRAELLKEIEERAKHLQTFKELIEKEGI
jgi:hypothetical protein